MKLYIATTSLNFDAIVSTDSVSPASFYPQRNFGIPFIYEKASLCLRNSILLTDVFPIFNIGKSDVDHRPMVVEIAADNYPKRFTKVRDCDGFAVYSTDKTIYLSPASCKLYFRSEADKRATVAKAESILESKYLLYERLGAISVYDGNSTNAKIDQNTFKGIVDNPVLNSESVKEDIQINKAKGFIFSYLIGASQAVSADSARLLRLTKEIKNGIYSLGTKKGKAKNASDVIYHYAYEAEAISESLDTRKVAARKRVEAFLETNDFSAILRGASTDEIILFLKKTDLYRTLYNRLNSGRLFSIIGLVQSVVSSKDDSGLESSLEELEKYVHSIVQHGAPVIQVQELFTLFGLNYMEVKDSALTDETRRKVETMYNLYSGYNYVATGIRENRIDYIIDAGKEFFPEQTLENQRERDYVNAMLDNLEHAASFDIMGTESAALQALAVFMRSPDADLDKMASLIISNEIPDARIAFGLWGLFHGYSSIPQGYYNEYVKRIQHKDIDELVRQVYGMLFGVEPVFVLKKESSKKARGVVKGVMSLFGIGVIEPSTQAPDKQAKEIQASFDWSYNEPEQRDSIQCENTHQLEETSKESGIKPKGGISGDGESLLDECEDLPGYPEVYTKLENNVIKGFKKSEQIEYYCKHFKSICSDAISYPAIKSGIDRIDILPGSKTNWDKVKRLLKTGIDAIARNANEQMIEQRRMKIVSEVAADNNRQFVKDNDAWNVIFPVLPKDNKVLKQIKQDLEWFQHNYCTPDYYEDYPCDNVSVIANYEKYLKNKQNTNTEWLADIYSRVSIDDVISALKSIYR